MKDLTKRQAMSMAKYKFKHDPNVIVISAIDDFDGRYGEMYFYPSKRLDQKSSMGVRFSNRANDYWSLPIGLSLHDSGNYKHEDRTDKWIGSARMFGTEVDLYYRPSSMLWGKKIPSAIAVRWSDRPGDVNYYLIPKHKSGLDGFSGKSEYHSSWSDTKVWAYEVLSKQYAGMMEDFDDDFEVAWYWFCNHYHEGQWSDLYSDLSNSPYSPGPMRSLETEGEAVQMLYEDMIDVVEGEE